MLRSRRIYGRNNYCVSIDDCIVVREETTTTTAMDSIGLTIEDLETQPRGALMTTSQTESAGDVLDEELGPPILADESDKEYTFRAYS